MRTQISLTGANVSIKHQLFYDVTELACFDKGTGIQRVTRALLLALSLQAPNAWEVVTVRGDRTSGRFITVSSTSLEGKTLAEAVVEPKAGDIFLSVDLTYNITPALRHELVRFHEHGVEVYFVIYDLIPLRYPEWFKGTNDWFEGNDYLKLFAYWFDCACEVADGLLSISESVCNDVKDWLIWHKLKRETPPALGYFHLGSDINRSVPTTGLPNDARNVLEHLQASTSFLMVGTLEPRKGHELALDAVESLWAQGIEVNLVIVGRAGWKIQPLVERLKTHPRLGTSLFWLEGVSDEYLREVYTISSALLALSLAEGFGLPLVEAAYFGLPLIVRDIPVFREVCGAGATYFTGSSSADLTVLLQNWLRAREDGAPSCSVKMQVLSWEESARQLMATIGKIRGNDSFWETDK